MNYYLAMVFALLVPAVVYAAGPRIECDERMLEIARNRIATQLEPFSSYWRNTAGERTAALELKPRPYVGGDSLSFHVMARDQGTAARLLAYEWQLDGAEESGTHAIELLVQWASASPMPGTRLDPHVRFPNSGMDVARGMLPFVVAYDLMREHPGMLEEKRRLIETWFRELVEVVKEGMRRWEANGDFGGQQFQNHHAAHVLGLVILAAVLQDEELIRFATESPENPKDFKELIAGLILMPDDEPLGGLRGKPLHAGEIQDRCRTSEGAGLTYCHLSMTMMLYTADVLTRVTGDEWLNYEAPGGECLRLSAAFYSDFFRLRNAGINGGYYVRDHRAVQNNTPYLGVFEVALCHWPDVPNLKAAVRSMDRAQTPRSWLSYYGLPLLTHGVDPP